MNLLTLGDSFTFGEELADVTSAWPQLLANQLNYKLVNLGRPSNSNQAMCRQLIEHLVARANDRPDLIVIGWSSPGRTEHSDVAGNFSLWPGYGGGLYKEHQPWREELLRYINQYHNDEYLYQKYLHDIVYVQNFLANQNIRYLMLDTVQNEYYKNVYAKQFGFYDSLIDVEKFIGWKNKGMMEWVGDCPRGPHGHFLEQGHQIVANQIYEHIRYLGWLS